MKKILSIILALTMCLSVFVFTAVAAEAPINKKAPIISDLAIFYTEESTEAGLEFTMTLTDENKALLEQYKEISYPIYLMGDVSIDGGEWRPLETHNLSYAEDYTDGQKVRTLVSGDIAAEKSIKYRVYFFAMHPDGEWTGEYSNVLTLNEKIEFEASDWAQAELAKADELGLIPESLKGANLAEDITRAEFAAVSVKAYEVLANTKALPVVNNPFTDTKDAEVLKAYNVGITTGVSATEFQPDALLNREQAATMLTRVFKRATLDGWTIQTDGQFALTYEKPALFADDADISDWAKESVYFMAANNIINGVGDNKFAPKNITSEEEATGYANATREQALIIAMRMVENLK